MVKVEREWIHNREFHRNPQSDFSNNGFGWNGGGQFMFSIWVPDFDRDNLSSFHVLVFIRTFLLHKFVARIELMTFA